MNPQFPQFPQFPSDAELIAWLYSMSKHTDFGDPMKRAFHQAADTIKRLKDHQRCWECGVKMGGLRVGDSLICVDCIEQD